MATIPLRRSQPAALKLARGNSSKRRIKHEPLPVRGELPLPPSYLNERAKAEWKRLAPDLHALGLLTVLDLAAFAALVTAYSRWVDAEKQLQSQSLTVTTPSGAIIQHPLIGIARRAAADVLRLSTEFGLTPGGRQRLGTTQQPAPDEWEGLLGGSDDTAN